MNEPPPGIYRHYKNHRLYRVHKVGYEEATLQRIVIYEALYDSDDLGSHPWMSRPLEDFMAMVETSEGVVPRFGWIGEHA